MLESFLVAAQLHLRCKGGWGTVKLDPSVERGDTHVEGVQRWMVLPQQTSKVGISANQPMFGRTELGDSAERSKRTFRIVQLSNFLFDSPHLGQAEASA